jgi:hypothetical protein
MTELGGNFTGAVQTVCNFEFAECMGRPINEDTICSFKLKPTVTGLVGEYQVLIYKQNTKKLN